MIAKLDTRHRFADLPRRYTQKLLLGVGGSGREGARTAYMQEKAFYGKACPTTLLAEVDLCFETGRGLEPSFVPDDPGALHRLILPGLDCRALVQQHGGNYTYPMWIPVDPEQIKHVVDTSKLGGFACPLVARAVMELYAKHVDEFLRVLVQQVETARQATVPGWERTGGPLHVFVYASLNGAVGSTAMHVIDRLGPRLKPPFRVVFVPLLLADEGRVTDRAVAGALQHAGLTEILQRSRGRHD